MKRIREQSGFSAIELLITLFIATAFLISGYQLYSIAIKDSRDARMQAIAVNKSQDYLSHYKLSATNPCTEVASLPNEEDISSETDLPNTKLTVTITCPYAEEINTVSKISVKITYGDDNNQKVVNNATYVSP